MTDVSKHLIIVCYDFFDHCRLSSKASRAPSVLSVVHRRPFGVVTSVSGSTVNPRRFKWSLIDFIESVDARLRIFVKREWKISCTRSKKFHKWMTQSRSIPLPAGPLLSTNVSSIMGHTSFIMLAFGFMESDVVLLRSYAIGGIAASILFQYYRAQPLWLPISWNVIFLLINGAMITALIQERAEASHLEPEEAEVFSECYDKFGVDPVDFMRVIRRAERRKISEGTILSKAGDPQKELHLVIDGRFKVYDPDGLSLGHIRKNQYIGSMAFLRFMNSTIAYEERSKGGLRALVAAAPPPISPEEGKKDDESKNNSYPRFPSDSLEEAVVNAMESTEALAGPLKNMVNDTESQSKPNETEIPDFEKESITRSTVIAETASDVYTWDVSALVDFIRERPKEQHAMSVSIGADLSEKINQSRDVDINYYHMLDAALRFGEVLPLEKKKLQMFRKEHRISIEKHESMLNELGWTKNDFSEGVQDKEVSLNFSRYIDPPQR